MLNMLITLQDWIKSIIFVSEIKKIEDMDKTKINVVKVIEVFNEVSKLDLCSRKGKNNPRVCDRQFLYGDILDFLKDYYNELNPEERDMAAKLIIGDYVVKNTLL